MHGHKIDRRFEFRIAGDPPGHGKVSVHLAEVFFLFIVERDFGIPENFRRSSIDQAYTTAPATLKGFALVLHLLRSFGRCEGFLTSGDFAVEAIGQALGGIRTHDLHIGTRRTAALEVLMVQAMPAPADPTPTQFGPRG